MENPQNIIAEGEVTGHAHRAVGPGVSVVDTPEGKDIIVRESASIVHEEHGAFTVPAMRYETGIVLEQDHVLDEVRNVRD